MPPNIVQPPPIQRAILSRHHSRRSASSIAPKLEPGITSLPPPIHGFQHSAASPKTRPTPPSHGASPTSTTQTFSSAPTSLASPTTSNGPTMPTAIPPHMKPQMPPIPGMGPPGRGHMPQQPPRPPGARDQGFYPTQSFQSHIEQLGKLSRFLFLSIELCSPMFNS